MSRPGGGLRRQPKGLVLLLGLVAACGSELGPDEAEGGYLAFRDALLSGHPEQLWAWVSEDTKQVYRDAVSDLHALAESVQLLSPTDRALAYERTGVRLADRVSSGEELFAQIVRLENLRGDERYRLGTEIDNLHVEDEASRATVTTRSEQEVALVKEDDGIWRVSSFIDEARRQLRPIAESVSAVDIMAAESVYMRRSHAEIVRLLGGEVEEEAPTQPHAPDGTDE